MSTCDYPKFSDPLCSTRQWKLIDLDAELAELNFKANVLGNDSLCDEAIDQLTKNLAKETSLNFKFKFKNWRNIQTLFLSIFREAQSINIANQCIVSSIDFGIHETKVEQNCEKFCKNIYFYARPKYWNTFVSKKINTENKRKWKHIYYLRKS